MKLHRPASKLALALIVLAAPVAAQDGDAWNSPRVLQLVARARAVRHSLVVDTAFRSYRAEARGYVYFFIDRPDSDERTLVKTDQIALEIFWEAPNYTKQRIVGLRDEKVLPTNIRYHLDHLTVVQDDFGDYIRLGDGDEVEQVLHPIGPASENVYDFLLSDSLSISYAAGTEEVRVYELRVRPKDFDRPGFIGTVYVDRGTGAIVRMTFSFTPASYVDPYLDYIRISLDNSLWDGRYWLPYRQEAEIRRELPVLDFLAGSIIRGRFEIGQYDFNTEIPDAVFLGRGVTAVPLAQREAFPFERGLFDDLEEEGLGPSPSLEEIQAQLRRVVQNRYLSGLSPLRLHLGSASEALRYDRAEGVFIGAGVAVRPTGNVLARTSLGYALARRKLSGAISASGGGGRIVPTIDVYWDEVRDLGGAPGASTLVNTLAASTGVADYLDPYFARGMGVTFSGPAPGGAALSLRWEEHRSAQNVVSDGSESDFRPVRSVLEGFLGAVEVTLPVGLPADGRATVVGALGRLGSRNFAAVTAEGRWSFEDADRAWSGEVGGALGAVTGDAPAQALFLLGGRGTLPGHPYRDFVGDRFWLVRAEGTLPLWAPWLGLRAFGAVGASYLDDRLLPGDWKATDSDGLRASLGVGLSFGWDVVRLDLARGLRGGTWEMIFSVTPRLRAWL